MLYSGILKEPHFEGDEHVAVKVIEFSEHMKRSYIWGEGGKRGNIDPDLTLNLANDYE